MKSVSRRSDGKHNTHYALTVNSVFSGCRMYNTNPLQTKKVKAVFYPMLRPFRNSIAFWNVLRLRRFVFLVTARCRWWRWVWITDGITVTGEERSTRRKTCPSTTLSTTNLTRTDLRPNRCTVVTGRRLNAWAMAGLALKKKQLALYLKIQFVPRSKHSPSRLQKPNPNKIKQHLKSIQNTSIHCVSAA